MKRSLKYCVTVISLSLSVPLHHLCFDKRALDSKQMIYIFFGFVKVNIIVITFWLKKLNVSASFGQKSTQ